MPDIKIVSETEIEVDGRTAVSRPAGHSPVGFAICGPDRAHANVCILSPLCSCGESPESVLCCGSTRADKTDVYFQFAD